MKPLLRLSLAASICMPTLASAQASGQNETRALAELDLDALLAVSVSSAARKEQSLFEAASAIDVLSTDDITRSGASLLPETLRYATGAQVARHASRGWAISLRGFNEDSSNKLEVLMDGRSLYTHFFSGPLWDHNDYVLADIDRIEVARGPAATMWGANAVNGVINIYTKGSEATQGTLLQTTLGTPESITQSARVGFQMGENLYARVYAKYYALDNMWFEGGDKSEFDATEMARVGFRTDFLPEEGARLMTQGELYTDKLGLRHDDYPALDGGHFLARWEHRIDSDSSYELQTYYDRYDRLYLGAFQEVRETADFSGQFRYQGLSGHDFVGGGGYRYTWDQTEQVSIPFLEPANEAFAIANLFLQDEISLGRNASVLLGATLEHNSLVNRWEFQPSARVKWTPSESVAWWAAVSRAVRTPARADTDLRWITPGFEFRGNREHRSEEAISYEIGHRYRVGNRFSADFAIFYTDYDDLPTTEPKGSGLFVYENMQRGRTWGGEASLEYKPAYWSTYTLSYAYLGDSFHLKPGSAANAASSRAALGNNAENIATLGAVFELPAAFELSSYLRYMDDLPSPAVPEYWDLDLRLAWAPGPYLEFALLGRNLLDPRRPEYQAASPFRRELSRSIEAQATLSF